MSLPAQSLEQILDYEGNLESGFVACLRAAGIPNVFSSRGTETFQSPCVQLWVDNGRALQERQHVLDLRNGANNPWTCFEATLHTIVSTNRADKNAESTHSVRVAQMRKNLMLFFLTPIWRTVQQIQFPYYIAEAGALYNVDPNRNIDTTELTWDIRHAVNELAWPVSLNVIPPVTPEQNFVVVRDSSNVVITDSQGVVAASNS